MELDLGPELESFRTQIRAWIADNTPAGLAELTDWNASGMGSGNNNYEEALTHPVYAEWSDRLLKAGMICASWPKEYGGQDWTALQNTIFAEEAFRAGVPTVSRGFGETMVGPSVMVNGTQEQKDYFLPRIITAEDVYCQGFSEPDHGSDLGAVATRGVIDGDEIVITGQKIWTSQYYRANMIFILVRTDTDAPKHRGISYVLLPFTAENHVEKHPVRQIYGGAEFGHEFFDGSRAPLFNIIGGINNGWRVAMTTLGHERTGSATIAYLQHERELQDLIARARELGRADDPVIRQQLAWAYAHVQVMRFSGLKVLAQIAAGKQPGPEASMTKLFRSDFQQRLGEIAVNIEGAAALVRDSSDGPHEREPGDYVPTRWQAAFLAGRSHTIYSGTNEIQRNIIAERVLGMPKEPSAARG
ncbi:MAG: acyl-CoA dehydrogenase family protein [Frankiaceae bacterium]|jgi:alkylation response protein AidB-like acyl-CoA dehydrogenase|nr:acyl-CoA dehydrogenase family protein [Frankiaceae bacterium]